MYSIEKADYGLKLTFTGVMDNAEAYQFSSEFLRIIASWGDQFLSIIVDAREFVPVTPDVYEIIRKTNQASADIVHDKVRIATIVNSPVVRNMSKRLDFLTDSSDFHQYINASDTNNPELVAYEWAVNGIEPRSLISVGDKAGCAP